VSNDTAEFLSRYDAIKAGWATGLPYGKTSNRFVEAVSYFEHQMRRFEAMKEPEQPNLEAFQGKKNK
jgi:hypothetical protein